MSSKAKLVTVRGSILDGYSPGCSQEGKLCMAITLHGQATWVCQHWASSKTAAVLGTSDLRVEK